MTSSSCPDVNVWLALVTAEHVHYGAAKRWWEDDNSDSVCFCRLTQIGLLRLLTTAAVMNGKPLIAKAAWAVYDRLFTDERVTFLPEPANVEAVFRAIASGNSASPKVWADAYLIAFAQQTGSRLVTFDKGLAAAAPDALFLS